MIICVCVYMCVVDVCETESMAQWLQEKKAYNEKKWK